MRLTLATRDSELALAQSREVAALLAAHGHECELLPLKTRGDLDLASPLRLIEGKGLFTKEIDRAVLDGHADIAVHSLKDLPVDEEPGLALAAVPPRRSDADVLVSDAADVSALPAGSVIACGSLRRQAQVKRLRQDIEFADIRGNIHTRLRKLRESGWNGLVMALAALQRLGLDHTVRHFPLPILPAAGQGALGIRARAADRDVLQALAAINCAPSMARATAEREFLRALGGGCHIPAGMRSTFQDGNLRLEAAIFDEAGNLLASDQQQASAAAAAAMGEQIGRKLAAAEKRS